MKKRKETTRAMVKAALRMLWMKSPERAAALKETGYRCADCGIKQTRAGAKEDHVVLNVHHVDEINWDFLDMVLERVFRSEQIALCRRCHSEKHRK